LIKGENKMFTIIIGMVLILSVLTGFIVLLHPIVFLLYLVYDGLKSLFKKKAVEVDLGLPERKVAVYDYPGREGKPTLVVKRLKHNAEGKIEEYSQLV
jgi:hypothetical protein